MRLSYFLLAVCAAAALAPLACGSSGESGFPDGSSGSSNSASGASGGSFDPNHPGTSGASGSGDGVAQNLESMRIDPADASIVVTAGQAATQGYRVFGKMKGAAAEVEITSRSVFYVPDNYLVGGFPANGGPMFTSRLPAIATDPPQRGGKLTVRAQASNSDGTVTTATTSLTVQLTATLTATGASPALPPNPGSLFTGTADGSRAPVLAYPNDRTILPPNLKRLEVHYLPGSASNQLFEISFSSALSTIRYYTRCTKVAVGTMKDGACGFELDPTMYAYVAESNRGADGVTLSIRGTNDTGAGFGQSAAFQITFGETNVEGGIYYWDVRNERIMRYDFAGTQTAPEIFVAGQDYGLPKLGDGRTCVGCHVLSRDGSKIVASIGGEGDGALVFLNDLSKPPTPPLPDRSDPNYFQVKGVTGTGMAGSAVQFATFNPSGSQFAAIYGDTDAPDRNTLWLHDGTTGLRTAGVVLPFEPDHPDWSPDGSTIAVTHVGDHELSQTEKKGGIDLLTTSGPTFTTASTTATTLVPIVNGKNRFNPNFVPDGSFLLYTEATGDGTTADVRDATAATTWAIQPKANTTPIHLDNAAKAGVADGAPENFRDTFPRSTPFQTKQGAGKLFWFTVASRREPGERKRTDDDQQLLWMFAIDPAKIMAGQDGSYPGFFLPFQDLQTSNHIGQWTQRIVSSVPPPAAPAPPPAPPAPSPPPVK